MGIRIGINGFGRIGRQVYKAIDGEIAWGETGVAISYVRNEC